MEYSNIFNVCLLLYINEYTYYIHTYIHIIYTVKNKGTLEFTKGYARNKRVRYTLQVKRTLKGYATCHKKVH